jgi:hypothetical protein
MSLLHYSFAGKWPPKCLLWVMTNPVHPPILFPTNNTSGLLVMTVLCQRNPYATNLLRPGFF